MLQNKMNEFLGELGETVLNVLWVFTMIFKIVDFIFEIGNDIYYLKYFFRSNMFNITYYFIYVKLFVNERDIDVYNNNGSFMQRGCTFMIAFCC